MNITQSEQEKTLGTLLPFGEMLIKLCNTIDLHPIVYGSMAYIYYTKDKDIAINDIDFLIPKDKFPNLIELIKKNSGLTYEETTYNSIKVFRDGVKIAFDSIEDYLKGIDFKTEEVELNGKQLTIIDKASLKEVYKRGAATIPFKKEAYTLKLDKLSKAD